MSVIVVATITPRSEFRGEVIRALEDEIARVHRDDSGSQLYALHEDGGRKLTPADLVVPAGFTRTLGPIQT